MPWRVTYWTRHSLIHSRKADIRRAYEDVDDVMVQTIEEVKKSDVYPPKEMTCLQCGGRWGSWWARKYKFCPNCGASMKPPTEESVELPPKDGTLEEPEVAPYEEPPEDLEKEGK